MSVDYDDPDGWRAPVGSDSAAFVVFVVGNFRSHLNSTIGLARRLVQLGLDVEYWTHSNAREVVIAQGFHWRHLKGMVPLYEDYSPARASDWVVHPLRTLSLLRLLRAKRRNLPQLFEHFTRSLDRNLRVRRPDLVILHAFAFVYFPFFARQGIPCVELLSKPVPIEDRLFLSSGFRGAPRRSPLGAIQLLIRWGLSRARAATLGLVRYAAHVLRIYTSESLIEAVHARTHFLAEYSRVYRGVPYDLHFREIPEWVTDAPEFDFPRSGPLPPNIRYIGLCVDPHRFKVVSEIERNPDARLLVFVCMGLSMRDWDSDLALLERIISGLAPIPRLELIVSTGNRKAQQVLSGRYPQVKVFEKVAQPSVLSLSDLAVTHAGGNTVRECIQAGVPMLAYPRDFDQPIWAARIELHGLGLCGSRASDSSGRIRERALRILDDRAFRARVERLRDSLEQRQSKRVSAALEATLGRVRVH